MTSETVWIGAQIIDIRERFMRDDLDDAEAAIGLVAVVGHTNNDTKFTINRIIERWIAKKKEENK